MKTPVASSGFKAYPKLCDGEVRSQQKIFRLMPHRTFVEKTKKGRKSEVRRFLACTLLFALLLGLTAPGISAADKPYAGVELVFLRHSGYDADWMASKTEEFYRETGIRVIIEQIAYSEMHNKFVLDASTPGGTYDLFATTDYWLPRFYEGGWIVDLKQFINNPDLYDPEFDISDVSAALLENNSIDGQLLAMPWKFNSQFLFYRTDLLEAPPANWEEFLAAAKAHHSGSTLGVGLALGKASIMDVYLNLLYQNGGTLLSEDLKTCTLDTPEAREALEFLVELAKYTSPGAINNHWDEVAAVFAQGRAAMAPMVSSQVDNVVNPERSDVYDRVGYAEWPGAVINTATSNTWGICITKNCEYPEAAYLFIQFLLKPSFMEELVVATKGATVPVRSSLLTSERLLANYPHFSIMNDISTLPGHTFSYPKLAETTAVMDVLATHIQNAILGRESVDEALRNAKVEIEGLL